MFRNVRFGFIIGSLSLLAAIGFSLIIIQSVRMSGKNADTLTSFEAGYFPSLQLNRDLGELLIEIQQGMQDAVAAADPGMLEELGNLQKKFTAALVSAKQNPVRQAEEVSELSRRFLDYYNLSIRVNRQLISEKIQKRKEKEEETDKSVAKPPEPLKEAVGKPKEPAESGPAETVVDLKSDIETLDKNYTRIREILAAGTDRDAKRMAKAFLAAKQTVSTTTQQVVLIAVVFLALLALMTFLIYSEVTRDLRRMNFVARKVAEGDLSLSTIANPGNNEFAQLRSSIDGMARNLRNQVMKIKEITVSALANSSQVTSATSQLASAASEQASAIAETTSTIEEVKLSGSSAKENASGIVDKSEESVNISGEGLSAVESSAQEVRRIREQVDTIFEGIGDLNREVVEVEEIIEIVNLIAEQSKLLAVNASIEAASAGEAGRGFSVVAQEVKELAVQSAEATSRVRKALDRIRRSSEEVVSAARVGRERAESGVDSIGNTGEVIRRLGKVITDASNSARQIAISANEQFVGFEQIALAMTSVNEAASENLTSTQQVEQGVVHLTAMARELEKMVKRYRLTD